MNKLLCASMAACLAVLATADMNQAQAQFGITYSNFGSYGVPVTPSAYCPQGRQVVGYPAYSANYGYRYVAPSTGLTVTRSSLYGSPYIRSYSTATVPGYGLGYGVGYGNYGTYRRVCPTVQTVPQVQFRLGF